MGQLGLIRVEEFFQSIPIRSVVQPNTCFMYCKKVTLINYFFKKSIDNYNSYDILKLYSKFPNSLKQFSK